GRIFGFRDLIDFPTHGDIGFSPRNKPDFTDTLAFARFGDMIFPRMDCAEGFGNLLLPPCSRSQAHAMRGKRFDPDCDQDMITRRQAAWIGRRLRGRFEHEGTWCAGSVRRRLALSYESGRDVPLPARRSRAGTSRQDPWNAHRSADCLPG